MYVGRRLRRTAEDLDDSDDVLDDDLDDLRELIIDLIDHDPDVRAAIRRLGAAAKPKPETRGGRRG